LLALVLGAPVAAVHADGDPASDVLLGQNVFYPYSPPVSRSLQRTLDAETKAAAQARVPVKVALIASPVDLGVVPDLFGQPQRYAQFLDQEISFQHQLPLLVVMPAGYGVRGLPAAAAAAVAKLPRPQGRGSDALATAAITAVAGLARASGHPLPGYGTSSDGSGSGPLVWILAVVAVVLAAAFAAVTLVRRRTERA
jgi:hypothetical protein